MCMKKNSTLKAPCFPAFLLEPLDSATDNCTPAPARVGLVHRFCVPPLGVDCVLRISNYKQKLGVGFNLFFKVQL